MYFQTIPIFRQQRNWVGGFFKITISADVQYILMKELLSLCPKKLHCPVPLETLPPTPRGLNKTYYLATLLKQLMHLPALREVCISKTRTYLVNQF